jgi:hypothetical protein
MKASTIKSIITKSVRNLHDNALSLIISDDSVEESVIIHYQTIINALNGIREKCSDKALENLSLFDSFNFTELHKLNERQSREFYKRLSAILSAIENEAYKDSPLSSLRLHVKLNGQSETFRYSELQSIFGHKGTTQAGYFARCMRILGVGTIDDTIRGNQQQAYRLALDWKHPAMQRLFNISES